MDSVHGRPAYHIAALLLAVVVVTRHQACADALVVTRAMKASTIAEIFIEEERVRTEIEVGAGDLAAFGNILPDELYEQVTGRVRPLSERLQTFIETDWIVQANGQPLHCRLEHIVPARRVVRDEVTGEALAVQPADAEVVIRLTLSHELEGRPQSVTIRPPQTGGDVTVTIGFVCYHNGLPVNDFRYLPEEVTLDLDWDDPWYSRFRHPNLRRQFDAPLSAFLYIEPYEVRKEIIIRPRDLRSWIEIPLRDDGVISVDQQDEIKKRVADFLSSKNPVSIDGRVAEGSLDRIHFIRRTLRTTGIIEPPVELDAASATLGVIFVYPIDELPEEVSMKWELFNPKVQTIPMVASDEAGGLPSEITLENPVLTWKNYLKRPTSPKMLPVARPAAPRQLSMPLLSALCAAVAFAIAGWQCVVGKGFSGVSLSITIVALAAGALLLPIARVSVAVPFQELPALSEQEAKGILERLLHNVYRSFDHHDESLVYDRLARSLEGELLPEVYLETRQSMEVKNQGGLRISVKEVLVTELESIGDKVEQPTFRCRWRVSGWIGHWGHVHRRENEHVANITIAAREGAWKITDMELLDEQPAEPLPSPSRQGNPA